MQVIRDEIKAIIAGAGRTMTDVIECINEKHGKNVKLSVLSSKLKRGTLRYGEALEIAEALGYRIEWVKGNE